MPEETINSSNYQLEYLSVACGKTFSSSKHRTQWKFGFANKKALSQGLTGEKCRGNEHEVTLVWSVTSGKRMILQDNKEIYRKTDRTSIVDHSWILEGTNTTIRVIALAGPQLSANPNFRQYDLHVDGVSFFKFPKPVMLGMSRVQYKRFSEHLTELINKDGKDVPFSVEEYKPKHERYVEKERKNMREQFRASIEDSRHQLQMSIRQLEIPDAINNRSETETSNVSDISDHTPPADVDLLDLMGDLTIGTTSMVPTTHEPQFYTYDGINLINNNAGQETASAGSYDPFAITTVLETPSVASTSTPSAASVPSTQTAATYDFFSSPAAAPAAATPAVQDPFSLQASPPPASSADPFGLQASPQPNATGANLLDDPFSFQSPAKPATPAMQSPMADPFAPQGMPSNVYAADPFAATNPAPAPAAPKVDPMSLYSGDASAYSVPAPAANNEVERHNPFDENISKLVNFDNLNAPMATPFDAKPTQSTKSKGLPPTSAVQPSLAELQTLRNQR